MAMLRKLITLAAAVAALSGCMSELTSSPAPLAAPPAAVPTAAPPAALPTAVISLNGGQ